MDDTLAQALEALKTMDWGTDLAPLKPIDEVVVATYGDAASRAALEKALAGMLAADVSRDAKDYICRHLRTIGTAASVPALAALLPDAENSHMARYALERIEAPEAAAALRDAAAQLSGELKIGAMGSLGVRGDLQSVPVLAAALGDNDPAVVRSAAMALGDIGTTDAVAALSGATAANDDVQMIITDAMLACAENLASDGKKVEALTIYKKFVGDDQPKHVQLAAKRGMLTCMGG